MHILRGGDPHKGELPENSYRTIKPAPYAMFLLWLERTQRQGVS